MVSDDNWSLFIAELDIAIHLEIGFSMSEIDDRWEYGLLVDEDIKWLQRLNRSLFALSNGDYHANNDNVWEDDDGSS
jgi:hypothetical protein